MKKIKKLKKIILRLVDYCGNVNYIQVTEDSVSAYSSRDTPQSLSNFISVEKLTCQDLRDKLELGLSQGADHVLKLAKEMVNCKNVTIQRVWED